MKNIIILGSTGSIGTQALEVVRSQGYNIIALTAGSNVDLMEKQAREFKPIAVALADITAANELKIKLRDTDIKVYSGEDGICDICSLDCDIVLNSVVGIAGLKPTLCAIEAGHTIALANKETLVAGGDLVNKKAREKGVKIIPVDSEHSAIFQSLQGVPKGSINKILLTASGGPFFGKTKDELKAVTLQQALKHPNWSMGAKITVDSATMMNKGLEVIEAMQLFGVKPCQIQVLVHRQSILHSGIELCDGAVIAQLGTPDMKIPIQYALTYPQRGVCFEHLDLFKIGSLTFEKPDLDTFTLLRLAFYAAEKGGTATAILNGANEEAVAAFIKGKIGFCDISRLVENVVMSVEEFESTDNLDKILYMDKWARSEIKKAITQN